MSVSHGLVGYGVRLLYDSNMTSEDREFESLWDRSFLEDLFSVSSETEAMDKSFQNGDGDLFGAGDPVNQGASTRDKELKKAGER